MDNIKIVPLADIMNHREATVDGEKLEMLVTPDPLNMFQFRVRIVRADGKLGPSPKMSMRNLMPLVGGQEWRSSGITFVWIDEESKEAMVVPALQTRRGPLYPIALIGKTKNGTVYYLVGRRVRFVVNYGLVAANQKGITLLNLSSDIPNRQKQEQKKFCLANVELPCLMREFLRYNHSENLSYIEECLSRIYIRAWKAAV